MSTKAQPLLVLGDRRRRALLARVTENARRWRESWVPGSVETFDAECEAPAPAGFAGAVAAATTRCWAVERAGERIAVLLLPHATFGWCVQEAGATACDTGGDPAAESLAEKLEREVAQSLVAELCEDRRAPLVATRIAADALIEWSRRARAWSLHVKAAGAGRAFTLLLNAASVETLAPAPAVAKIQPLQPRREAIGENLLALRAVVGETAMSLSDLGDLALDDVLVLDQHLAEPVTLVSRATGAAVAAGNLGRSGARRAIKVATAFSQNAGARQN